METKKYKLLKKNFIEVDGRKLYRVKRLSDGLIGGYIESEKNLSHEGSCFVYDDAKVHGNARVYSGIILCKDVAVSSVEDFMIISPLGSRNSALTIVKGQDFVATGCFFGTKKEFLKKVKETHGDNKHAKMYRAVIKFAFTNFEVKKEKLI